MKYLVIAVIGVASALGGAGLGRALQPDSQDEGHYGRFILSVEPSTLQSKGSSQALEYRVHVNSRFTRSAQSSTAIEVVDDRGRSVQRATRLGLRPLGPRAQDSLSFTTPAGLRDGYYQVRVSTAMADGDQDELQIAERYFRVKGGEPTPLSSDEWFQQSAANVGSPL
jgi:hypothetical protein